MLSGTKNAVCSLLPGCIFCSILIHTASGPQMVEDQNGGVVLIGGESSSNDYLDTLYQLPHGSQDAVWTKMEQQMKTGRYRHTAFFIPDNIFDCS